MYKKNLATCKVFLFIVIYKRIIFVDDWQYIVAQLDFVRSDKMKKKIYVFFTILSILSVVTACSNMNSKEELKGEVLEEKEDKTETEKIEEMSKVSDYFPFLQNTLMVYYGEGNEYAEQRVYFDYIEDNKAQIRMINAGTEVVQILEYKDGELRKVYSEGEFYHIKNLLKEDIKEDENVEILLKEPLKVGMSWKLPNGENRTITGSGVEINTPYKKFKALEVTTELGDKEKQIDYYVKGIGHVASIYSSADFEVKTLLESFEENKPLVHSIRFYYPEEEGTKLVYKNTDFQFRTNDSIESIFESGFKNPPSSKEISLISKNTKINSIVVDKENKIVKVDFSKELIEEMNAGSSLETQILNSMIYTFTNYYGVDKVYISTDGKPYSSGHYEIRENEYFTREDENIEELK